MDYINTFVEALLSVPRLPSESADFEQVVVDSDNYFGLTRGSSLSCPLWKGRLKL